VAANSSSFVASLFPFGHDTGILHSEVYGIIAASILSHAVPHPHILSDHLNSINLLLSSPSPQSLKNNPAHALYCWLLDIWSTERKPNISHIHVHTNNSDIALNLNWLVDHLASDSQHLPIPPPCVPVPTFFMDNFMLFSFSLEFIESSIPSFVDFLLAKTTVALLDTCHEPLPPLPLFDQTKPHKDLVFIFE
jgi:hypothetical protein